MQVKQRLRINNVVLLLSALVVIVAVIVTSQHLNRTMEQNDIADALITASFERLALQGDYMRTGSERARDQIQAKNRHVGELLMSAASEFTDADDKKTIAALTENHESIGKIFLDIIANRGPKRNAALAGEVEDRLLSQMNMRAYEAVILGGKLQGSTHAAIVASMNIVGGSIALALLLMSITTLINSVSMNRTITSRIGKLRDGTAIIGGGDLAHRIDIQGDDEFADLSTAFNEMASKLRESYQALEREVVERRLAEEKLRESSVELQAVNTELIDSRRAAINLVEDALDARKQTDDAAAALARIHKQTDDDRRRLEAILETIPVGVVLIEAATNRFSLINRRAAEIYGTGYDGFDLEDHIARVKLLQPDGTPFPWEDLPVSHTWRGEEVHNAEMTIERAKGIRVPLVVNTAPLRDAEGNVISAIVAFDDITDRKRAEQQINGQVAELRLLNEDLTRFNKSLVSRELRMIELKKEINELCAQIGQQPRYPLECEKV